MVIDFGQDAEYIFERRFRAYLREVARAVGVGLESCTMGSGPPAWAYIALDRRLPGFPGADLALVWDEVHGWAAAVEEPSRGDVTKVVHLGGDVLPEPRALVRFLAAVLAADPSAGVVEAPLLRLAGRHEELLDRLSTRPA
jgi:hypothetical protein